MLHQEGGTGVAGAKGLQCLQRLHIFQGQQLIGQHRVQHQVAAALLQRRVSIRQLAHFAPEGGNLLGGDGEPRRLGVAAEALQQVAALLQRGEQREPTAAAAGAFAPVAL